MREVVQLRRTKLSRTCARHRRQTAHRNARQLTDVGDFFKRFANTLEQTEMRGDRQSDSLNGRSAIAEGPRQIDRGAQTIGWIGCRLLPRGRRFAACDRPSGRRR
jgi:hypothetical protein